MSEVAYLFSTTPQLPTLTPAFNASMAAPSPPPNTLLPWEMHMQVHTILIVVIFCVVCLLLLLAFFYAFCFHCSIRSSSKDLQRNNRYSLDREDATYRCTSSDGQSVGNIV